MSAYLCMMLGAFPSEITDPNFAQTVLLIHGDGTNAAQNNTFLDSSSNNFSITRNGNTTQGSFSPFGIRWSNYFDGDVDYLSLSHATAFDMGSSDFTAEAWVYRVGTGATTAFDDAVIFTTATTTDAQGFGVFDNLGTFKVILSNGGGAWTVNVDTGVAIENNMWIHVALVRYGNTFYLYKNGTQVWSGGGAYTLTNTNNAYSVGGRIAFNQWFYGYISNNRVVKGRAVYTSNFTPPTSPLGATSGGQNPPQGTETSCLICQSNRYVDNSTNALLVTRQGDTKLTTFSPFVQASAYSPSVNGGSGYFDGSGDYLNVASANCVLSGDFTVEAWVYPTAWGTYQRVISGGTGTFYWSLGFSDSWGGGNLVINWYDGSDYYSTAYAPKNLGCWYHLAVCRTGSTLYYFINGVRCGTSTYSATPGNSTGGYTIGRRVGATEEWNGYISSVRVTKGSNVYGTGTTCTLPTAPFSSSSDLLLNFTNAAIYDQTGTCDLETVGNAQISTSVKKYGTGSMSFDGTGDYLVSPPSPSLQFANGDFTLEFWVYFSADPSSKFSRFFLDNITGGYTLFLDNTTLGYYNRHNVAGDLSATWDAAASTWYHVAITRSGSTVRAFIDGTQIGSGTASNAVTYGGNIVLGGNPSIATESLNGYIDDLRISRYARYTANFTPPTGAFADR